MTFFLLPAFVAYMTYQTEGGNWMAVGGAVLLIVLLFGIIVLHELGHALTARRYGIGTRDIVLYPIGGVAMLNRMPDDPRQEFLIAVAGPAVNVVLAILFALIAWAVGPPDNLTNFQWEAALPVQLMFANIILVLFNMLPAFPMDGGRALRALLAMNMPRSKATQIAVVVGRFMAVLFAVFALMTGQIFLLLIAMLVWFTAGQEAAQVAIRDALRGVMAHEAMIPRPQVLDAEDSLNVAAAFAMAGWRFDFPVYENGQLAGILTQSDMMKALEDGKRSEPIGHFISRQACTAHPNEPIDFALERLQLDSCPMVPVVNDAGEVVGILTREAIGRFITLQHAHRRSAES